MKFRTKTVRDEPEINLIPFIDILLVIIIFLMISTTFSQYSELKINLPSANANEAEQKATYILVAVTSNGTYQVNGKNVSGQDVTSLQRAMASARQEINQTNPTVVIHADSQAPHQTVINVMEAARISNLNKITFATQKDTRQ